jgi:hypothetical protein
MIIPRPLRTMLARITPGPAGFDIRTLECPACDHVHQRVVEVIDPMKSKENCRLACRRTRLRQVRMNRYWTDEENEHLKTLVAQACRFSGLRLKFNRTIAGVRAHAKKNETPFPPVRELRKKRADTAFT